MRSLRFAFLVAAASLLLAGCLVASADPSDPETVRQVGQEWDSQDGNPTHATHSYLTEYAIDRLRWRFPELQTYRALLVDGANRELHELPLSDPEEEALRVEAEGTNWGASHPERTWRRARAWYAAGDRARAYWYLGMVLHWVEDMGVPAHALHVVHQGTFAERDGFEVLALQSWSPSFNAVNRWNPRYGAPSDYVAFSGAWAAQDFAETWPGRAYTRTFFPTVWLFTSRAQAQFVRNRQGRTAVVTEWALESALTHW
jgi:hypothetical protein